jgi:transposase-like protein
MGALPVTLSASGVIGNQLKMICVGAGTGLRATFRLSIPVIRVQRCWAHKIRNVLDKMRVADQPDCKPICTPS